MVSCFDDSVITKKCSANKKIKLPAQQVVREFKAAVFEKLFSSSQASLAMHTMYVCKVLCFFPNSKLQNAKITTVILQNFKSLNVQITEWPIVRHVISSNFLFLKRQIFKLP
jgi:hypothetical protein